ncbi:MAG: ATP-binding protein [Anaerolineae bacterium]
MKPIGEILKRIGPGTSEENTPILSNAELEEEGRPPLPPNGRNGNHDDGVCPICGGLGYVRRDVPLGHPDFGRALHCICQLDAVALARSSEMRSAGNMAALEYMTFERFELEPYELSEKRRQSLRLAYEAAQEFAEEPRGWLVLTGTFGCGKTHLAAAIANDRLAHGRAALFVVVPDLLDYLRATFGPGAQVSYDERFETIRTAPVLILDDLGAQSSTPWAQEKLFQILNHRYASRLPTVITTNMRMEDIDERLRSRLQDETLVRSIRILAPDYRRSGTDRLGGDLSTLNIHRDQSFESFDLRQNELPQEEAESLARAMRWAKQYAEDPRGWLVFMGAYGSGKTHLAAAIANARVDQGDVALFVVVPDLLDHLRATFSPTSATTYDKRFEEVRNAPFLVLDDLGTESATPWAREKLFQLVNHRYAARLPTVITTSTPPEEMDERLATRLFDTSRCTVFAILAPAYRGARRVASSGSGGRRRGGARS